MRAVPSKVYQNLETLLLSLLLDAESSIGLIHGREKEEQGRS